MSGGSSSFENRQPSTSIGNTKNRSPTLVPSETSRPGLGRHHQTRVSISRSRKLHSNCSGGWPLEIVDAPRCHRGCGHLDVWTMANSVMGYSDSPCRTIERGCFAEEISSRDKKSVFNVPVCPTDNLCVLSRGVGVI